MRTMILVMTLTACTGSPSYWRPYTPIRAQTSLSKETAIQKAVVAMTDAGREIESSDAATGIVLSKWWSGDGFGGSEDRFRVRVTFADAAYEIVALCQSKDAMTSAWKDCEEQSKRPQFVLDVVGKVKASLEAK